MQPNKVTEMARYQAARQAPINDACRWSSSVQAIAEANLKAVFVFQRVWLRSLFGG